MTTVNEKKVNYIWESLTAPVEEDRSIIYKEDIRLQNSNGTAASVLNSNNRLVFHNQDISNIYLPSEAELEVEFSVVRDLDVYTPFAEGTKATLIANGWNLFRRGMFKIGDQILGDPEDCGVASTTMDLVYKSKKYLKTVGTKKWTYYDTGAGGDDESPVTLTEGTPNTAIMNASFNAGFAKRRLLTSSYTDGALTARKYTIRLPLRDVFGYLRDSNAPVIGNTITFELDRDDRTNRIVYNTSANAGKVYFHRAEILMPKVKPSLEVGNQITQDMLSGIPMRIPYHDIKTWTTDLGTTTQTSWTVTSKSAKPVKVYFAFRRKTRITSQAQNGALFDNVGVTRITLDVNNKQFPEIAYESNFDRSSNNYMRLYQAYLQAGHKGGPENDEVDAALTAEEWADLYTIYCFDISKRDDLLYENITSAELRLNVSCGADDKWAYCIVESEKEAVINGLDRKMSFMIK